MEPKVKITLPRPHTLEVADWIRELNIKFNEYMERHEVKEKIEREMREACKHYVMFGHFPEPKSAFEK